MAVKIWSEQDLKKRDQIGANVAWLIEIAAVPRMWIETYIQKLTFYEILTDYLVGNPSDDEIRQLARDVIKTPRRLSKPANFDYYNKFPRLSVKDCIFLLVDVNPGTQMRTQAEKCRYESVFELALSYGRTGTEPFAAWGDAQFSDYKIAPHKFIEWLKDNDIDSDIPPKWRPIGIGAVDEQSVDEKEPHKAPRISRGDSRRIMFIAAAIKMLPKRPSTQKEVLRFIEANSGDYPDFFKYGTSDNSIMASVREAGGVRRRPANPLKDQEYLQAISAQKNVD